MRRARRTGECPRLRAPACRESDRGPHALCMATYGRAAIPPGCPPARWSSTPASAPPLPLLAGVVAEGPGWGELSQLVADHRLGDVDGHVLAAVMDGHRVADHVRDDRRAPRPGLDDPLLVARV